MISIICPLYNEEYYIATCIESILAQDYPKNDVEVIFVDGMSVDNTREIVSGYIDKYPFIKLIDNPYRTVPYAMNKGIEASTGQVIMRLDAHATYEKNYFSVLVNSLKELNADNVGAVCHTDVLNRTSKSIAIKEVLSNKWGVGNSVFRTGTKSLQRVDTVPFGCWKREVFTKYGLYDVRLTRNQDIELNSRILNSGGKIYIVPNTYCTYLAREKYKGLFKNNYLNGKWNVLTVFYTKRISSLSIRHFIPLFFVLSSIVPLLCAIFYFPLIYLSALTLLLYFIVFSFISIKLSVAKKLNFIFLLSAFAVLHISYGIGSLIAILNLWRIKVVNSRFNISFLFF